MNRRAAIAALVVAIGVPALARAQTPFSGRLLIGATGGAGAVQNVGGAGGGELAFQITDAIQVFGEALWMQDVVTRRRVDLAQTVTSYLQSSQGKSASGTVTAPATYGGGGVRLVFMRSAAVHPYVAFSGGVAHVAWQPTFSINGSDITGVLPQFGVAIGSDLTGETTKAAFGGGGGVQLLRPRWYLDGRVRVISIRTPGQPTNVLNAGATIGLRF